MSISDDYYRKINAQYAREAAEWVVSMEGMKPLGALIFEASQTYGVSKKDISKEYKILKGRVPKKELKTKVDNFIKTNDVSDDEDDEFDLEVGEYLADPEEEIDPDTEFYKKRFEI